MAVAVAAEFDLPDRGVPYCQSVVVHHDAVAAAVLTVRSRRDLR